MLSDNIKNLRIKKGITQEELGNMLNKTKNNISQYETGKRTPDADTLLKLSEIFNVSIDMLLGNNTLLMIDEPELSLHEQYANKIAKILEDEGLEYTEDTIPEIINFSKYILSKKKQD